MCGRIVSNDELIIRMLKSDDEHAIKLIFDHYYEILFDVINQSVHDPQRADDLVQDLLINIWVKRHALNLRAPLQHYLVRSAANRARNYKRDKSRSKEVFMVDYYTLEDNAFDIPVDSALAEEDIKKLWNRAKASMNSQTRVMLILSRKRSMTYKEIALHLGVSKKTVEKNLSTALKILREVFKSYLKAILFI